MLKTIKYYLELRKVMTKEERKKFMRYFLQNKQSLERFKQGFKAHQVIILKHYTDNEISLVGKDRLYYAESKTMFTKNHFWNLKSYDVLGLAKMIVSAELGSKKLLHQLDKGRVKMYVNILNKL